MRKNNYIALAKKASSIQINELKKIKKVFNNSFVKAVDLILNCKGKVIFAGVGKSGLIAKKISATFSSVGIPSFFCDPAQALHGDMGQIEKKDILALSLGAFGVLIMLNVFSLNMHAIFTLYNLYFVLAALLWPIVSIISSKSKRISPLVYTFYLYLITSIIDGVFFVDFQAIQIESFDTVFYLNMAIIILAATTFGNTIYFLCIEKLGAKEANSFIFLVPFSAISLGGIFLDESISFSIIIGSILTLIAVKILNNIPLKRKKK